ncbi:hypothetical protein [Candidatus Similichlamydia laticola]|uniref:hypothetical protein n=1 Tax=Candidatus Similichlamydia laticola TaxID=2170265 RepID=UPI0011C02FBB|nr:hypothetical protein [Candidatus Similichlamydia laticola]
MNRSNTSSDVVPIMGTQFIEVSTTPRGPSGQSGQFGVVSVGLSGHVNLNVSLFGSCHILFEPYRCHVCLGAPSFIAGGSYSLPFGSPQQYFLCFCEGVWGYYSEDHRDGYLQPLGFNIGLLGVKECCKGLDVGLACGFYRRTPRDLALRPSFSPGPVFYCSPEISCHLDRYATLGSRCGLYFKQQDALWKEETCFIIPKALTMRWEFFYQIDLGDDLTVRLSYVRSSHSTKFGNAALGINLKV